MEEKFGRIGKEQADWEDDQNLLSRNVRHRREGLTHCVSSGVREDDDGVGGSFSSIDARGEGLRGVTALRGVTFSGALGQRAEAAYEPV